MRRPRGRPPQPRAYAPPPPAYIRETRVVVQDNYVYYPAYQVYYGGNTHQYVYQEGRSWVSRPAPPRVSADVLFASPSVRLNFHDSAGELITRRWSGGTPKNWAPTRSSHGNQQGHDEGSRKGYD